MPSPIPVALRERAVRAYESGEGSYVDIAERFAVSRRALQRWEKLKQETGSVAPRERGGGRFSPVESKTLDTLVAERPEVTTSELTVFYNRRVSKKKRVHRSSVLRALHRAGYVFKKSGSGLQSKIVRT